MRRAVLRQRAGFAAAPARRPPAARSTCTRRRCLGVCAALQLTPTGDGTQQHLDAEVAIPGAIKLQEGLFEVRHCRLWTSVVCCNQ